MKTYLQTNWDFESDELIEVFDETPLWSAPFGLKLLEDIKYKKGIKALDIGFGAGFPLTELAMRLGTTSKVYGIDPWEAAIRRAEKKIKIFGISNIEIIHGDIENIPLESNSIDLVVSNNGLNNVEDLEQSLMECARISKPGAQFIQTVNLHETMMEFYSALEKVFNQLNLTDSIEQMHQHIYKKRKPLDKYLKMIENAGFTVESVTHDQFNYHFADATAMFNHFFIRLAFIDSWKELVPPEQYEQVFSKVEEALNKKAEQEGVLKLSVPFVVIDSRRK
ncbi:class I SAM-dependent methyltransferase [Carboxylicivirga linearis]|uniref:Methyltransferase domain-containing protein n=1 Tax=Carboxylicivirga linearis TaxID=1628157 RepID=A0ABS5JUF3_9BACT|nr:class I SAM-dependent methyltransferase [Carboxylicivirga linearis]MBS2098101.1 methyltransferase domain-containing protein [Carboxylicivirga linearis]